MLDIYEPAEEPDDARMRRAANGDTAAFAAIVRGYQGRVGAFAMRMLDGDRAAAEDVTQETFLRLWRTRCAYRAEGKLAAYLLRIAANLCRDRGRTAHPTESLEGIYDVESKVPGPAEVLESLALREAIERFVAELPAAQREVFVLSQFGQLSYREIADIQDCAVGTVASRRNMAVQTLRRRLRPYLER